MILFDRENEICYLDALHPDDRYFQQLKTTFGNQKVAILYQSRGKRFVSQLRELNIGLQQALIKVRQAQKVRQQLQQQPQAAKGDKIRATHYLHKAELQLDATMNYLQDEYYLAKDSGSQWSEFRELCREFYQDQTQSYFQLSKPHDETLQSALLKMVYGDWVSHQNPANDDLDYAFLIKVCQKVARQIDLPHLFPVFKAVQEEVTDINIYADPDFIPYLQAHQIQVYYRAADVSNHVGRFKKLEQNQRLAETPEPEDDYHDYFD